MPATPSLPATRPDPGRVSRFCIFPAAGLLLLAASAIAQESPARIAPAANGEGVSLHLSDRNETNSWTIEASEGLEEWEPVAELIELNGRGRYDDTEQRACRYYRVLSHGNDIQAAIDRCRLKWQQSGITDYEFHFRWICFCIPGYVQPVIITVEGGLITRVRAVSDGMDVDPANFGWYRTVDGLFDYLQDALDNEAHRISARCDPHLGHPLRAFVDRIEFAVDDEQSFEVGDLRPLASPQPVQISDASPVSLQQDGFTFGGPDAVRVDGDTLTLRVQYGGGCRGHDFDLFMSPGAFLESSPVQANLYLRHNANGDLCKALITEDITFDLTPIAELYMSQYGQADPIRLNVFHYFEEDPAEHTSVTYTP